MTTCDHGIRIDRFCGDCEDRWEGHARMVVLHTPAGPRRCGLIAAACLLGMAVLAGIVWVVSRG